MNSVLITGGSEGLGRALALQYDALGARVAVVGRRREKLETLKSERPSVHVIEGDVSDQKQIHRIYAEAFAAIGAPTVLINNASSLGPEKLKLLIDTDCEDVAKALETNVLAPFRLSKLALPSMLLRGSGCIVNISSDVVLQNYPEWGPYSVSKSALDHLTRIFDAELEGKGVRFLAVDPGDMHTSLHLRALPNADVTKLLDAADSAALLIKLIESGASGAQHRSLR